MSLLKLKKDPEPVVLISRIHSTGKSVLGTQDSRSDIRDNIPESIRGTDACRIDSGSYVQSSIVDHCTQETGTRLYLEKSLCKKSIGLSSQHSSNAVETRCRRTFQRWS